MSMGFDRDDWPETSSAICRNERREAPSRRRVLGCCKSTRANGRQAMSETQVLQNEMTANPIDNHAIAGRVLDGLVRCLVETVAREPLLEVLFPSCCQMDVVRVLPVVHVQ